MSEYRSCNLQIMQLYVTAIRELENEVIYNSWEKDSVKDCTRNLWISYAMSIFECKYYHEHFYYSIQIKNLYF